ncbi:DUF2812 domain-containing protein [Paenibacillus sp. FSL R7-0273]|uniref:DUF2812 domain-containing protein n=1 Tax=Paenibacillus sp. FSL R7-0273 TaxID=1536772 RepID=UPI00063F8C0C|nr:DUF2812 domain-containing protein [Paenibacillus sp. FSL R7-0273]OMF91875.1 hypothetical protein BK144_14100 [Paenibacillus sp. FSL R7-0273]
MKNNSKQTKHVLTMGLAFAEEAEMKKLSRLAAQGWLLDRLSPFGFIVRRGTAHKLDYCLDIRMLQPAEEHEYRDLFADSGWNHVCSSGDLHIFSAEPGTVPIHTDRETLYDKYSRVVRQSRTAALIALMLTAVNFILLHLSAKLWDYVLIHNISLIGVMLSAMLLVPSVMVYFGFRQRLKAHSS